MLRYLAIVALFLAVAPARLYGNRSHQPASPQSQGVTPQSPEQHPEAQLPEAQLKDRYYWKEVFAPAALSNWSLAIVAVWAGRIALKTLKAIETQTGHLRDSVVAAAESAEAAKANVQITIAKERARLSVEVVHHDAEGADLFDPFQYVRFRITNGGSTNAFNVRFRAVVTVIPVLEAEELSIPYFTEMGIPSVIQAGSNPIPAEMEIFPGIDEARIEAIRSEEEFMHLLGSITYDDVFGGLQTTNLRYVWRADPYFEEFEERGVDDQSGWMKHGSADENRAT
jgi:hypothetical protein